MNTSVTTNEQPAELIHAGEFDLAGYIVESTDPLALLEGFTNAMQLAVQLIARHACMDEDDVFDLIRAGNDMVTGADSRPKLDEVPIVS